MQHPRTRAISDAGSTLKQLRLKGLTHLPKTGMTHSVYLSNVDTLSSYADGLFTRAKLSQF